jgi:PGDYG protein
MPELSRVAVRRALRHTQTRYRILRQMVYVASFTRFIHIGSRAYAPRHRVSAVPSPLFRSSGQRGYLNSISADPRRVSARKLEREVQVRFTPIACIVQTNEGMVHARPGDAILTGIAGEHWRVSRERFAEKYRPVPPTLAGESGRYLSLPNRILALPMTESFQVMLADGESRLNGHAGDWLVDYGDGSLGIVSPGIFATTYEIVS